MEKPVRRFKPLDITNPKVVNKLRGGTILLATIVLRKQFVTYLAIRDSSDAMSDIKQRIRDNRLVQTVCFSLILRLRNKAKKAFRILRMHNKTAKINHTTQLLKKMHQSGALKMVRTFRQLNVLKPCRHFFYSWYKNSREATYFMQHKNELKKKVRRRSTQLEEKKAKEMKPVNEALLKLVKGPKRFSDIK